MRKLFLLFSAGIFAIAISACTNTADGIGDDIEEAGDDIEDATD